VTAILVYGFWFGFHMEGPTSLPSPPNTATAPTSPATISSPNPTTAPTEKPSQPKETERTDSVAVFIPGQESPPSPWLPLAPLGLLLAAGAWLAFREEQGGVVKDSPEFVNALKIWMPLITAKQNTPRSIKRFLNKVRYLAMRQRPQGEVKRTGVATQTNGAPGEDGKVIPESILVALSAVQQAYPEWTEKNQSWTQFFSEHPQSDRAAHELYQCMAEHNQKFTNKLTAEDTFSPTFIEISKGIRVRS
jgi:hypothetical protein